MGHQVPLSPPLDRGIWLRPKRLFIPHMAHDSLQRIHHPGGLCRSRPLEELGWGASLLDGDWLRGGCVQVDGDGRGEPWGGLVGGRVGGKVDEVGGVLGGGVCRASKRAPHDAASSSAWHDS